MTSPLTLPAGPRAAVDSPRMTAKILEDGDVTGFTCILDDCEANETLAPGDPTEENGDAVAAKDTCPETAARNEVATPLLFLPPLGIPLQMEPSQQSGTPAIPSTPTLLTIAALQGLGANDLDGLAPAADINTSIAAGPGDEIALPEKDAELPNMKVPALFEGDEAVTGDWKPRGNDGLQSPREEKAPAVAPVARSPEQGTIAPPAPVSPATQIILRIAEFANTGEGRVEVAQSAPLGAPPTPALPQGSAVKMLRIRLEPESLGEVEVTLRQTAKGVRVEIQAARTATAEALAQDLNLLDDKLSGILGTSAATAAISISLLPASPLEPRPSSGAPQSFTTTGHEAGAAAGGMAGQRQSRPEDEEPPFKLNRTRADEDEATMRGSARTGRVV